MMTPYSFGIYQIDFEHARSGCLKDTSDTGMIRRNLDTYVLFITSVFIQMGITSGRGSYLRHRIPRIYSDTSSFVTAWTF